MQNLKILNSRETKHLLEMLERQYGFDEKKSGLNYIFMMNKDNRIYVVSRDASMIDFDLIKIDTLGLYFGEIYKESIRLSIEGAQIVGQHATKNVIYITKEDMLDWVKGNDLVFDDCGKDFVIVKHKNVKTGKEDIMGCGKYKDGKLMNYVSKSRRLIVVNE
jgi:NOL1/NOP2/fmu family ribosome biogenesis protein